MFIFHVDEWEVQVEKFRIIFMQADTLFRIAQGEIDVRRESRKRSITDLEAELKVLINNPESVFASDPNGATKRRIIVEKLIQDEVAKDLTLTREEELKLDNMKTERLAGERTYYNSKSSLEQKKATLELRRQEVSALTAKHTKDLQAQEGAKDIFRSYTIKKQERSYPYFIFDVNSRKTRIYLPSGFSIKLPEALQRMLGFIPQEAYFTNDSNVGLYEEGQLLTELTSDLSSIYIYCNIINTQYVGDALVPLLRVVHLSDTDGIRVTKTFQNPFYMSVTHPHIDMIEIDIRDSYGRPIHFSSGAVVLNVLHFRRANNPT